MKDGFAKADRAVDKAANAIASQIKGLLDGQYKYEGVAQDYLVRRLLLVLLRKHDLAAIIDQVAGGPDRAMIKLSNALLDYRDHCLEDI
jgi:hypothetical protein